MSRGCRWAVVIPLLVVGLLAIVSVGGFGLGLLLNLLPRPAGGPTVEGPEATDLLPNVTGRLAWNEDRTVATIDLPSLAEHELAQPMVGHSLPDATLFCVSNPDRDGQVAYVVETMGLAGRHAMMSADPDGSPPRKLFERPGDALWYNHVGEHLALSPGGGQVAYIRDADGHQFPMALIMEGPLELCDTATGRCTTTKVIALDEGLSWFPDNRRLAFVGAMARADAPPLPAGVGGPDEPYDGWDPLPVVQILDTRTGEVTPLHIGESPRVATDGQQVLVACGWERLWLVPAAGGESRPVTLPGLYGEVLALWPDRTALYWAMPTAGTKRQNTTSNSPLVGPKTMLTIKVGVLDTTRFQTVVPLIDPRTDVAWGPAE